MEHLRSRRIVSGFASAVADYVADPGLLPATDALLARSITLGVGVVDAGIGSAFGINVRSTSTDIEKAADRFRTAVERHHAADALGRAHGDAASGDTRRRGRAGVGVGRHGQPRPQRRPADQRGDADARSSDRRRPQVRPQRDGQEPGHAVEHHVRADDARRDRPDPRPGRHRVPAAGGRAEVLGRAGERVLGCRHRASRPARVRRAPRCRASR